MISYKHTKNSIIYDDSILEDFLKDFTSVIPDINGFINECNNSSKKRLMLNLLFWYIRMVDISALPDSARLTFLLGMAEANIKIRDNRFDSDKDSSDDVRCFFNCMSQDSKDLIAKNIKEDPPMFLEADINSSGIVHIEEKEMDFGTIVEIFLNVRHRFVHGKNIYEFRFNEFPENIIYQIIGEIGKRSNEVAIRYLSTLTFEGLRGIMIKTALENIKNDSFNVISFNCVQDKQDKTA